MSADPWHYPRRDFAERTLLLLASGPSKAVTLFGPRRTGKTEFLLRDLGPLAEERGHRAIYMTFWQAPLAPLAVLLHALEAARRKSSYAERARAIISGLPVKLELSSPIPGTSAKAQLDLSALAGKPPSDLLLYLDDLLGRLANTRKPTLLFFDEVQELARDPHNAPLVAALRSSLDKRSTGLASVFTGSSSEALRAMFAAKQAPFFHFATPLDLPPLGEAFVDHLAAIFARVTKRKLPRAAAQSAFVALDQNPEFFRKLLDSLVLNPGLAVPGALAALQERLSQELGYPRLWLALNPLQRALAAELGRGADKPFSQETRLALARNLRVDTAPTIAQVQAAMRRLASLDIVEQWAGRWTLADPQFAKWLLAQV